jgi:thiamine monophosphate synthase
MGDAARAAEQRIRRTMTTVIIGDDWDDIVLSSARTQIQVHLGSDDRRAAPAGAHGNEPERPGVSVEGALRLNVGPSARPTDENLLMKPAR